MSSPLTQTNLVPKIVALPEIPTVTASVASEFDRTLRRRLGRGAQSIDDRLDLHGLTQLAAHRQLLAFLSQAQARGARIVIVITGKGSISDTANVPRDDGIGRGILRRSVPLWLKQTEFRPFVIAFSAAARHHGGEGALYVRVRRRMEKGN